MIAEARPSAARFLLHAQDMIDMRAVRDPDNRALLEIVGLDPIAEGRFLRLGWLLEALTIPRE